MLVLRGTKLLACPSCKTINVPGVPTSCAEPGFKAIPNNAVGVSLESDYGE